MKVWHDDTRPAPKGWVWAQTNNDARAILKTGEVTEISLDHDMGGSPGELHVAGSAEDNGTVLVKWMIEHDLVPETVVIHSWNGPRAKEMMCLLRDVGIQATYRPFNPREHWYTAGV